MYGTIQGDERTVEQQINAFFLAGGLGLNITLPFKKRAYALALIRSERARHARAANTLWMHNQQLYADNTDGIGLVRDLTRYVALERARVLILGAGGAAQGIIHPLLNMGVHQLAVANRTWNSLAALQRWIPQINCVHDWSHVNEPFDVIINAASVPPELPFFLVTNQPFCYDLNYSLQQETSFVRYARANGCVAVDGLGMLIEQAAESFFLWHGVRPDTTFLMRDYFKRS